MAASRFQSKRTGQSCAISKKKTLSLCVSMWGNAIKEKLTSRKTWKLHRIIVFPCINRTRLWNRHRTAQESRTNEIKAIKKIMKLPFCWCFAHFADTIQLHTKRALFFAWINCFIVASRLLIFPPSPEVYFIAVAHRFMLMILSICCCCIFSHPLADCSLASNVYSTKDERNGKAKQQQQKKKKIK